jgi:hypothetical protein
MRTWTTLATLALLTGCPSDDGDADSDGGSTTDAVDSTSSTTEEPSSTLTGSAGTSSSGSSGLSSTGTTGFDTDDTDGESSGTSGTTGAQGCGMPIELGVSTIPALDVDGFHAVGDRMAIAVRGDGVALLDVSDPTSVALLGSYDPGGGPTYRASLQDNLIVGGRRGGGAFMVDASDPASMVELWVDADLDTEDIVFDDLLYLASSAGVSIVDVTTPSMPTTLVEDLQQDSSGQNIGGRTIAKLDDTLFMAGFSFTSIDVSTPAMPTTLADLDNTGRPDNLVVANGHVYVGGADGVQIFDISTPATPALVGTYEAERAQLLALDAERDRLFVFGSSTATIDVPLLRIVDVSDKANPVELGSMYDDIDDPLWAQYDNGRLYFTAASTDPSSLYILDGCPPAR